MYAVFVLCWICLMVIIVCELYRVLNHLLAASCLLSDIGMLSSILWLFEFRDAVFEVFARFTGSRLHSLVLLIDMCYTLSSYDCLLSVSILNYMCVFLFVPNRMTSSLDYYTLV